jgi:hypothetical protein
VGEWEEEALVELLLSGGRVFEEEELLLWVVELIIIIIIAALLLLLLLRLRLLKMEQRSWVCCWTDGRGWNWVRRADSRSGVVVRRQA